MRILLWGTYDTGKPRVRVLLAGLERSGVRVDQCHADVWQDVPDKSQVHGWRQRMTVAVRWLASYPALAWRLARAPRPDAILIGFPGILDMLVAAPIARLRRIPLVWDMFMSLYDTVVEDRQLVRRTGLTARCLFQLEGLALRRADIVFLDTRAHARRVEELFGLARGQAEAVWVGVETEHFPMMAGVGPGADPGGVPARLRVLFYGQFIPLHGIETIVQAARMTRDDQIDWHLIGTGQEARRIEAMLAVQPLPRLHWDRWVDYPQLHRHIAAADLCLGIFGESQKAASVIPNKVFQILAMGRPLVTRDSPAARELLRDNPPCVRLVPPADAYALAAAVCAFAREARPSTPCHGPLRDRIGAEAIGRQCVELLQRRLPQEA
ncbi:glycosyltransferase [Frateuria soli]|uniref:glycosyltransferase n=1 Tax=Frateuria soli TaxID=1542730 RepID=UPI001E29B677|nr:glycosyltransferase [Frateuria soli]UGB37563.1 glycosyltransferase [Frateuria soli]